jgi:hypothetical protein
MWRRFVLLGVAIGASPAHRGTTRRRGPRRSAGGRGSRAAIRGCGAPLRAFQGRRLMPRIISPQYRARDRRMTQASFRASRSFAIAARSGSDATILRSLRRTPLSRHSLIFAIASPRTKLPNSGQKRTSRRMTRIQNRFLTVAIFAHRGRRAAFQRGDARSADGFGRNQLDEVFAALTRYNYALALDMLKEGSLLWPVNVPKAEIVLVCAHLKAPPQPTVV